MSTQKERQAAFQEVLCSHAWGNKLNAGKNYKRAYSKTAKAKDALEKRRSEVKAQPVKAPAKKKK